MSLIKCKTQRCKVMIEPINNSNKCGKCKARSGNHHDRFRKLAIKTYGVRCMNPNCELTKKGVPITIDVLDVDHIKEVSSFPDHVTVQEINSPTNAMVLCVYCHRLKGKTW